MKRRYFLKASATLVTSFCLPAVVYSNNLLDSKGGEEINRQLRFIITLTNPKSYELIDQVLWLYLPVSETPTQKLDDINISVPHEWNTDSLGHTVATLVFPRIAPLATKVVNIILNLSLRNEPVMVSLENPQAWLRNERYIETTNVNIQALAATLKRSEVSDTALAIYEWVKQHLEYIGYVEDDRGAAYALD